LILLVYAHPHHERSVANRALLDAVRGVPGLTLHALYDRYPDFSIDVAREQALLSQA
jgi:putative NADPH-quinone reductase